MSAFVNLGILPASPAGFFTSLVIGGDAMQDWAGAFQGAGCHRRRLLHLEQTVYLGYE